MPKHEAPKDDHRARRYCEKCGAQIEGPGRWGHDDTCPHKKK